MNVRFAIRSAALASALLAFPLLALADGPDTFGIGSRNAALGSAVSAKSGDWASAYYNPAGLAAPRKIDTGFGINAGHASLGSFHDVVLGYDGNGNVVRGPVGTNYDNVLGFTAGVAIPLTPRFAIGATLWSPMQRLVRIMTVNPFVPSYVMYENRAQRITLNMAAAYNFGPSLRIGAGLTTLARSNFSQDFNIPAGANSESNNSRALITLDIVPTVAPIGGVQWDVNDSLSFGLAYRGQTDLQVHVDQSSGADVVLPLGNSIRFHSAVDITGGFVIVDHFTPQQVVLGTAWDRHDAPVAVFFDATYMNWAAFKGPYIDPAFDPIVVPPIGSVPVNWRHPPRPGFRDTVVPRLGVEYRMTSNVALRGGYSYEMTPVPTQTGEGNLLDANTHVLSAGAGLKFKDPLGYAKNPIALDAHVRVRELVPVTAAKDTTYDCSAAGSHPPTGYPCDGGKITASGSVVSGGANLTFDF
ncbi:MAG TPA: outer membrane protein transport protein [bacterium]|nr:outer membrane protein transport protein [bacterium]